jgi:TonB-linked SusC/RagA family outer membrane protein
LKSWLKVGNNFTYTNISEDFVVTDSDTWGAISNALRQMPTIPVFLENGKYGGMIDVFDYTVRNPVAITDEWKQDIEKDYVLGDLNLEIKPMENLSFRSVLGIEYRAGSQSFFQPANIGGGLVDEINIKREYRNSSQKLLYDNILTYTSQFRDIHNYSVMVGTSFQKWEGNAINAQGQEFPSNNPDWDLNMSTSGTRNAGGSTWEGAYVSQFGRITYDYDNKYLLTANIRRDGSTKFGSANRYGIFPSFSVGWIFTDEAFMSAINDILTVGKLRFGYGIVGSDAIGNFRYLSLLNSFEYTLNGQTATGYAPQSLENPAIRWESSEQFSAGADLSFLNDKVTLILDYYIKNTTGMLIPMPVPATSGIYPKVPSNQNQLAQAFPIVNIGEVKNTGLEMELTYRKSEGVFHYSVGGNLAYMKNLVVNLGYQGNSFNSYPFGGSTVIRTEAGHPIGSFYGYVADGIFMDYDEIAQHANQGNQDPYAHNRNLEPAPHRYTAPGDIRFKDLNRDGVIDEKDRTFIGSPFPDFAFGLNLSAEYKNFEISAFVQGVAGAQIMNLNRYYTEGMTGAGNFAEGTINRWTDDNPSDELPRAILTDPNSNIRISSRWIESGDYLRLKNLQLSYTLPGIISQRIQVQQMKIYVTGKNLYTLTQYSGYDPDVGSLGGNVLQSGIDLGRYPLAKTFLLGINLGL